MLGLCECLGSDQAQQLCHKEHIEIELAVALGSHILGDAVSSVHEVGHDIQGRHLVLFPSKEMNDAILDLLVVCLVVLKMWCKLVGEH